MESRWLKRRDQERVEEEERRERVEEEGWRE
jgi:hypothetical protein